MSSLEASSVNGMFAVQALGPEFDPQKSHLKSQMCCHTLANLSAVAMETGGSQDPMTGQPSYGESSR